MGHDHSTAAGAHRGRLLLVLGLTLGVMAFQVVGGVVTGSLALLGDAGHMAVDSFGIGLALFAIWIANRPFSAERTFGLQRAEILAAAANALLLFALCGFIGYEAVHRLLNPEPVVAPAMLAFSIIGLVTNLVALLLLQHGQSESLNLRGAYLEVLGDLLSSVGVVVAALLIWATGWDRLDSLVSVAIALFIASRAWHLLNEALRILLEVAPRGVDLGEVRRHLRDQPGVLDVHDLHAWTITSGLPVLSAHVVVEDSALTDTGRLLDQLHECLSEHFSIDHSTIQVEPVGHAQHEGAQHA